MTPHTADSRFQLRPCCWALTLAASLALAACGGGAGDLASADASAQASDVPADAEALPAFHRQPLALTAPSDEDADGGSVSAQRDPDPVDLPSDLRSIETRGLTDDAVVTWLATQRGVNAMGAGNVQPSATTVANVVYTPAQIRQAYGMAPVPSSSSALTAQAAAALGAGQTIFIIDAYHHPNALRDLAAFNSKFGLPSCTTFTLPAGSTTLPALSGSGCRVAQLYAAAGAKTGATAPAYNAGWASEIALDIQWAHAIAPLARIVLIEAPDASVNSLGNAIALANKMGPGIVSMSFGAGEGAWVGNTGGWFQTAGMTYLASTGDNGYAVAWPSVMSSVLAVGGTTLRYSGSSRSEVTWSRTGGGLSAYVAQPSYQSNLTIAGQSTNVAARTRSAGDLSFNADPATGQYAAFTPPGGSTAWYAFGGTSISAPQWAGLVAVSNAQRALLGKSALGAFHSKLYAGFAPSGAAYASGFYDINSGSNGTCAACSARIGYDTPTGLGTPKVSALLSTLSAL